MCFDAQRWKDSTAMVNQPSHVAVNRAAARGSESTALWLMQSVHPQRHPKRFSAILMWLVGLYFMFYMRELIPPSAEAVQRHEDILNSAGGQLREISSLQVRPFRRCCSTQRLPLGVKFGTNNYKLTCLQCLANCLSPGCQLLVGYACRGLLGRTPNGVFSCCK